MHAPPTINLDFRSDTVTRPTQEMRDAMARAEVGDDYYREDPTVNALEAFTADLFGKESALFTTSGTQSNLIAVLSHCGRGDAYVVGDRSHSYLRELGGAASMASVQPQVVQNQTVGSLRIEDIEAVLYPASILFAPARMIALENTIDGKVLPLDYLKAVADLADRNGLRMHLDGARVFNAACALDVPVSEIAKHFDTVGFCLSKGLGAPVGSLLVGSRALIEEARRHRQMLGGGLRQAGVLAAAGLHALQHHVTRLSEDHSKAARLAQALSEIPGLEPDVPETNMVFCTVAKALQNPFADFLAERGIAVTGTPARQRWVTHLDIDETGFARTLEYLAEFRSRTPDAS
ncbi:MAG: low-specificity L-threonine aldolase [Pseudomonadota bacterium]